jgi:cell division septation protein DedD
MGQRAVAIAIVAVISGICFTLGFFVGRTTVPTAPEFVTIAPQEEPARASEPVTDEEAALDVEPVVPEEKPKPVTRKTAAKKTVSAGHKKASPEKTAGKPVAKKKPAVLKEEKFSLQIGAYKNRKDAEALLNKFLDKGYTAYVYKNRTSDMKTIYQVRVGKFDEKRAAERLSQKLRELEEMDSFITDAK